MDPERWQQVRAVLEVALESPVEGRADLIEARTAGDASLKKEVEMLLASYEEAGSFLEPDLLGRLPLRNAAKPTTGQNIGPYRILREIGHGGMGAVFLAARDDEEFEQQVALKVAHQRLDSSRDLRRFRQERQILANLEHENIARLLDGGTTKKGRPYLVMEYVKGRPLDVYCDENRCSIKERLRLFQKVCAAVQVAHQNLIVHRDLKPANILVTASGVPKLLDFGIAKFLDPAYSPITVATTVDGARALTPDYASPEQIRGETLTTATDVYSLGVVLHVLLTAEWPYRLKNRSFGEISRAICEQEPLPPSLVVERSNDSELVHRTRAGSQRRLAQRLRGDLDNIVLCALQKDPRRRYSSAEQFAEDIRRELAGLPILARQDTLFYRSLKFIRRHRLAMSIVAVLGMLLAGLTTQSLRLKQTLLQTNNLLASRYWQGAHFALEKDEWLESAHLFAQYAATEGQDSDAVESAIRNLQAHIGNVELVNIIPHDKLGRDKGGRGALFSPDSRLLVTTVDDILRIWHATDGTSAAPPITHEGLDDVIFSADGQNLLTSGGGTAQLWNTDSSLAIPPIEHSEGLSRPTGRDSLCTPAFINQGRWILTCANNRVNITGRHTGTLPAMTIHHRDLRGASWSESSKLLLTVSSDGSIKTWNGEDGSIAGSTMPHEGELPYAGFHPDVRVAHYAHFDPSGQVVVALARIYERNTTGITFQLLNARDGSLLSPLLSLPHTSYYNMKFGFIKDQVFSFGKSRTGEARLWKTERHVTTEVPISFGPDARHTIGLQGYRLLTLEDHAGRMRLLDVRDGSLLADRLLGWSSSTSHKRSRDGRYMTLSRDREIIVLDTEDLTSSTPAITLKDFAYPARLSADNYFVISNTESRNVRLWLREDGSPYTPVLKNKTGDTKTLVSGDHCKVVTWDASGEARLWRLNAPFLSMKEVNHGGDLGKYSIGAALSPAHERVATWRIGGRLRIWSVEREPVEIDGVVPTVDILGVESSADRESIITWNKDGLRRWRFLDGTPLTPLMEHPGMQKAVFSGDRKRFLSWGEGQVVRLWSVDSGLQASPQRQFDFDIEGAALNYDGSQALVWGTRGGRLPTSGVQEEVVIKAWSASTSLDFETSWRNESREAWEPDEVSFDPTGRLVAAWGWRGLRGVQIWNIDTGKLFEPLTFPAGGARAVRFNRDGSAMLTFGSTILQLWDTEEWAPIGEVMQHGSAVAGVQFSPDEKQILSWSNDGTARLWNTEDGTAIGPMMGHQQRARKRFRRVARAQFSRDGRIVLSWPSDGTMRLWRAADSTRVGRDLEHGSGLIGAEIGPKGRFVLSWSTDGTVRLWDISGDYDFPREHLPLLAEAATGTVLGDSGLTEVLSGPEWRIRRERYLEIASDHAKECRFRHANLYLRRCTPATSLSAPMSSSESERLNLAGISFSSGPRGGIQDPS